MLKERRLAANQVAEKLFAAEAAIDAALAAVAELTATMPAARTQAGLSMYFGQEALVGSSETAMTLTKARGEMLKVHTALVTDQKNAGLEAVNFGALEKPNVFGIPVGSVSRIAIVKAA